MKFKVLALILLAAAGLAAQIPGSVASLPYDIVYVRVPRFGNLRFPNIPEVSKPAVLDAGADLMILHPDGGEELLVAGGVGAVTDPFVSFDAAWVYYSKFPDLQPATLNLGKMSRKGADIYRINLGTREIQQLTHGEFTPNTAAKTVLDYGVYNLGAAPVAGGKVAFVSNRNGFTPIGHTLTEPTFQLFVMDEDGENVTAIAPMTNTSVLHPVPLMDGRLIFSTAESQGLRDYRTWGLWAIWPDGRSWEPVVSAYHAGNAFHFATQRSGGDIIVDDYYNLNNAGFGALYSVPINVNGPAFFPAQLTQNPRLPAREETFDWFLQMPFTPRGMSSLTPFTNPFDHAAPPGVNGVRVGKVTQPSAAPNGDLLVVYTSGPANKTARPVNFPAYDAGLYKLKAGVTAKSPTDLVLIKNDPGYNEMWPRAVAPYAVIYGKAPSVAIEPSRIPWLPNDGTLSPSLPAGTPFGIVGTSSLYKRESFPGYGVKEYGGLDPFNTMTNDPSSNWVQQGSDDGKYTNADIGGVRIIVLEPTSQRSNGPAAGQFFRNGGMERTRILGEFPVRKFTETGAPILDPEGNPDTSFAAKIPADTPFTFQMLDKDGLVLTTAQTWHQVRPGEIRTNCGGCHAHSSAPLAFEATAAAHLPPVDLTAPAKDIEFLRDIRPILQSRCISCHSTTQAAGQLVLDDLAPLNGLGDFMRLASDPGGKFGYRPLIGGWRTNGQSSRYVRQYQSRRSLLVWKAFDRRLDGWTNADHPTERIPGDRTTLPAGAVVNLADLDYTTPHPVPGLTDAERRTIAAWVDIGAPLDLTTGKPAAVGLGWFLDEVRPTVAVSSPRQNQNSPLAEVRVGIADAYSGVNWASLSVVADAAVGGQAAGVNLAPLGTIGSDSIWRWPVLISSLPPSHLTVTVKDKAGNATVVSVRFWVK